MKTQGPIESYRAALFGAALLLLAACGPSGDSGSGAPRAPQNDPPALAAERVFPWLSFEQPVAMLQAPAATARVGLWWSRPGACACSPTSRSVTTFDTFVDISNRVTNDGEMGLLGMAFHPNFPTDPRVYLSYVNESSRAASRSFRSSRWSSRGQSRSQLGDHSAPHRPARGQPQRRPDRLRRPDGFLYIGMGDGGGANDQHPPIGNGQLMTTLLGKMLRISINVDAGKLLDSARQPVRRQPACGAAPAAPAR